VSAAGQLVTVYSLVYAVSPPVLMTMTGRAERRRLLVGSLLLFAAGNVIYGIWLSYGVTLAGRIIAAVALYGIGSYAFNPAQQHRLIGLSGPSAGIVLSLNASAIYLGSAGGAFLGGLVVKYGSAAMLGYFGGAWALMALALFGLSRLSGAGVRSGQPADG